MAADFEVPRPHVESMFGLGEPEIPAGGPATGSGGWPACGPSRTRVRRSTTRCDGRRPTPRPGTRLNIRFFGGWDYADGLPEQADWVQAAYAAGVPMGGDLPARPGDSGAPRFILQAVKDPDGANLDAGADRQGVAPTTTATGIRYTTSPCRTDAPADPATGAVPAVGNTVELSTATYTNTIGATQLTAVWEDPVFDPAVPAVYYLRVLEIPTPRWSLFVAVKLGRPHPSARRRLSRSAPGRRLSGTCPRVGRGVRA